MDVAFLQFQGRGQILAGHWLLRQCFEQAEAIADVGHEHHEAALDVHHGVIHELFLLGRIDAHGRVSMVGCGSVHCCRGRC